MKKILFTIGLSLSLFTLSQAQISITGNLPQNYSQDFTILDTNNVTWTDNSTIPGWLFVSSTNGVDAGPVTQLTATDGSALAVAQNLGITANTDRAIGSRSLTLVDTIELFYGARFVNNSSSTITNVNISYNGEQWRDSDTNPQTISFFHRVGGTNFLGDPSNAGWTATTALDFTSPQNTSAGILDGNAPANRTAKSADILVNLAPGQEFWIRWADISDTPPLSDHALGIDDVVVTFNGINPPPALDGVTIELKRPKVGKKLTVPKKGIFVKGFVFSTSNTISKVSYAAFGGTNAPTNLTFIDAGKFKPLTKGFLFKKKGVDATFKSTKTTKITGVTTSPVTLLVTVFGGSNNASQVTFTNVFTDVKIK